MAEEASQATLETRVNPEQIDKLSGKDLTEFLRSARKGASNIAAAADDQLGLNKPAREKPALTDQERDQLFLEKNTHYALGNALGYLNLLGLKRSLKEIEAAAGIQFDRDKLAGLALRGLEKSRNQ